MPNQGVIEKRPIDEGSDVDSDHELEVDFLPDDIKEDEDYFSTPELLPKNFEVKISEGASRSEIEVGPQMSVDKKQEKWPEPPKLDHKEMLTESGEFLDFSKAKNYQELIEMIRNQEYITNQLGQKISVETVINSIYDLTYKDSSKYKTDEERSMAWTVITLKHNLRGTVASLIRDYKKTDEFQALRGLDLSGAQSLEDIFNLLNNRGRVIDAMGKLIPAEDAIKYIKIGRLDLLPSVIKYKVIEINRQKNLEEMAEIEKSSSTSWGKKIKSGFTKLKFWGK